MIADSCHLVHKFRFQRIAPPVFVMCKFYTRHRRVQEDGGLKKLRQIPCAGHVPIHPTYTIGYTYVPCPSAYLWLRYSIFISQIASICGYCVYIYGSYRYMCILYWVDIIQIVLHLNYY